MSVQINNPDEEETIEVSRAEYEAVKTLAAGLAEQNTVNQQMAATTLESVKTLRDEMVAMAENYTATMASLVDAIRAIQIVVNVPQQPAPVINVPQQAAPKVTIQEPAEGKKVTKLKVTRDKNGAISGIEGTTE